VSGHNCVGPQASSSASDGRPRATPAAFGGPVRHVYVHVPFCRVRCDYCDFASTAVGDAPDPGLLDAYVDGIAAEWELEAAAMAAAGIDDFAGADDSAAAAPALGRLHTLYVGGGTPSLLGPDRLARQLELFRPRLTPAAEVTVEVNPEDASGLAAWVGESGVRVSLGVQSFSEELRGVLGRRAEADPAGAFAALRAAGAGNISIDLIHGIPGQTAELLEQDIAAAVALRPEHVSWYELDVVEGTMLAGRLALSGLDPTAMPAGANDDVRAAGYRRVVRALAAAGYDWYEVSNFALPGRRARHNVAYWRARPYLGLGPGAVSTVGARRWRNEPDAAAWAAALAAGRRPLRDEERLGAGTRRRERLMLAARCGLAVPLADLGDALDLHTARSLAAAGLVSLHSGTIRVTRKGRYVANEVCVRLFRDTHLRG
jgi:oxygen-independent coproporphyrinogen-3 oxidase